MIESFDGWRLADAVKRVTGTKTPDDKDTLFWGLVESGQLIAYGRRDVGSAREWISAKDCRSLTYRNYNLSMASGTDAKEKAIQDLVIYPVLHSPNAVEIIDGMPLREAFSRFVIGDPEVQILSVKAIEIWPELIGVYGEGRCYPRGIAEWPLVYEPGDLAGGVGSDDPDHLFADSAPPEVQRAADAICLRYGALLDLLRRNELQAIGDPVPARAVQEILPSIWSHDRFFWDQAQGDLLQLNDDDSDVRYKTRWQAVMLKRVLASPPQVGTETTPETKGKWTVIEQLTNVEESVFLAIKASLSDGTKGIRAGDRDRRIRKYLSDHHLTPVSSSTIKRCLKKIRFGPA